MNRRLPFASAWKAFLLLLILSCVQARAEMRRSYSDAEVIQHSTLIVIAHVKEGSIQTIPDDLPNKHHSLTLVITAVLKGSSSRKEFTVIIDQGLTPVAGRSVSDRQLTAQEAQSASKDAIEIIDTGNSAFSLRSIASDLREDHIWCLRPLRRYQPKDHRLGIEDPEAVQPLDLKPYFMALLSPHPRDALQAFTAPGSPIAERAHLSLDAVILEEASRITDHAQRCDQLVAHYLILDPKTEPWLMLEARKRIIREGDAGSSRLVPFLNDPRHGQAQEQIIQLWGEAKYLPAGPLLVPLFKTTTKQEVKMAIIQAWGFLEYTEITPLLVDLLSRENQFWATQIPEKDWWHATTDPALTQHRQNSYCLISWSLQVLGGFRQPQTRSIIEQTKKRWATANFDIDGSIARDCTEALARITTSSTP